MEERVSFDWVTNERIKISKVEYDTTKASGLTIPKKGTKGWVDWRLKLDSKKGSISDQLFVWESQTLTELIGAVPRGFTLNCSDWIIVPKTDKVGYDTCCAMLLNPVANDPEINIYLRGDGTEPCSV